MSDIVLNSSDAGEHRANAAVLSASLGGSFLEAERVERGQPVEIAASKAAVSALLDYVQPAVNLESGLELLRLAEACGCCRGISPSRAGFQPVGVVRKRRGCNLCCRRGTEKGVRQQV